jgi:hypothetical protein
LIQVLVSKAGQILGRTIFDQEQVRIGRNPDNDVHIEDEQFSRYHARLVREGEAYVLHDEESTNGVVVNGARVSDHVLNDGDEITVGAYKITLSLDMARLDDVLPADLAARAAHGATIDFTRERGAEATKERSSNLLAFLVPQQVGATSQCYLIDRDVFTFGSSPEADFSLGGLAARYACAIVRGYGGFSVHNLTVRPRNLLLDGEPVPRRSWLEGSAKLQVLGAEFAFRMGPPPAGTEPIRQSHRTKRVESSA